MSGTEPSLKPPYAFDGTEGASPGSLAIDGSGNLLVAVQSTGASEGGGVVEFPNSAGHLTPLISFGGQSSVFPGGLTLDANGNLLGTTQYGGSNGDGSVFEIAGSGSGYQHFSTTLVSFNGSGGTNPFGGVVAAGGNLFGTTDGGSGNYGTVFEIAGSGGNYDHAATTVASFDGPNGAFPQAGLISDGGGDLFGTTTQGGANGDGTVFELVNNGNAPYTLSTLVSFNGATPAGGLVADKHGDLFGMTSAGGTDGKGTVFELINDQASDTYTLSTLFNFDITRGATPVGDLIIDNKGNLFGMTKSGGTNGDGTAFEIADSGGTYDSAPAWVFSFIAKNGGQPTAGLVADGAGNLYGTTSSGGDLGGGRLGDGTIFELTDTGFMPCFHQGTRLATSGGTVAVEALRVGDLVLTQSGAARPVVWLGHRRLDCRRHPRPRAVWPVRIRAGAFGQGRPARDLRLSPDHALFLDGVLIPVHCLLDGISIAQEQAEIVVYWHVELARHDVLLAEGLPCESFLDTGNRAAFGGVGPVVQLHPDFCQRSWDGDACAPLVLAGPQLTRIQARLRTGAYSSCQARSNITGVRVRATRCAGVQASQSSSRPSTPRVAPARSSPSAAATGIQRRSSSSPEPASVPETAVASTVKNRASNRLGEAGGVTARHR